MPTPTRKGIFIVLLAMCLVVAVAVIPDRFGEGYQRYLVGVVVLGLVVLLFYTTDFRKWLRPGTPQSKADRFNIPPGAATRRLINLAKVAISEAEPEKSLQHLLGLKSPALDTLVVALNGRYAEYRRNSRLGLLSTKDETLISNQIKHDILDLIKALEDELATGSENYKIIKEYLKKRYSNRFDQKLAKRQPVNLRRIPSTEGTSKDRAEAFIAYNSDEVAGTMTQTFRDARGRLLLIGAPGAGKTTLMLQLVLDLLDSEPDALPVLLNLATWSSEYITLEAWLKKILPAELGVSEKYSQEIMQQGRLILLFDGFDEIREDARADCLEAIGRYGEDANRQFIISSRIGEYKAVAKDAPVHWQIEVGPLSIKQLETELNRLWEQENQPEARALLQAIQKDTLLRQSAEIPFYFNTLQILFSGGKTLADLHFTADTLEGRQAETLERFIGYELKAPAQKEYPPEKIKLWLSFLASRMSERNMVVFELRDLQYDWWKWSKWQLIQAGLVRLLVSGLIFGLISMLACGLVSMLISKFVGKLILGIFGALIIAIIIREIDGVANGYASSRPIIKTKDTISWSFRNFFKHLIGTWPILRVFGLTGLLIGLAGGGIIGLFLSLLFGNTDDDESVTFLFLTGGMVVGLIGGLTIGLVICLIRGLIGLLNESKDIIQISTPYHRFNASKRILYFSILQHKFLCYQLRRQSLLPPNLVQFLDEMSLRHILEFDGDPETGKGGGGWRFRHRILQEYFAEQWKEPDEHKTAQKPTNTPQTQI